MAREALPSCTNLQDLANIDRSLQAGFQAGPLGRQGSIDGAPQSLGARTEIRGRSLARNMLFIKEKNVDLASSGGVQPAIEVAGKGKAIAVPEADQRDGSLSRRPPARQYSQEGSHPPVRRDVSSSSRPPIGRNAQANLGSSGRRFSKEPSQGNHGLIDGAGTEKNRHQKGSMQARSWATVAKSAIKGYSLSFIPSADEVLEISESILQACDPKWQECLVGYFIGKKLPFKLTEAALKNAWGSQLSEVMANEDGFYFFHIPNADFRRRILEGGPTTVAKVPLILKQWHPTLVLKKDHHDTVPVLIINVYNQKYESAAAFWPDVHLHIIVALVISQLLLFGLMATKEAGNSTLFLIALPVLTIYFHKFCKGRFEPAFARHPLQEAMIRDTLERAREPNLNLESFLQKAYLHPDFKSADDDDEDDDNIKGENESVLVPTKRSSCRNTPLPSRISATSSTSLPEVHEDFQP